MYTTNRNLLIETYEGIIKSKAELLERLQVETTDTMTSPIQFELGIYRLGSPIEINGIQKVEKIDPVKVPVKGTRGRKKAAKTKIVEQPLPLFTPLVVPSPISHRTRRAKRK